MVRIRNCNAAGEDTSSYHLTGHCSEPRREASLCVMNTFPFQFALALASGR
jgi:hypothetical protein